MAFVGAPRTFCVKTNGNNSETGLGWDHAVASLSVALQRASGGNAVILIGPGVYEDAAATATISDSRIRIIGAGRASVLKGTSSAQGNALITISSDDIELENLTIVNEKSGSSACTVATTGELSRMRIANCVMKSETAATLYKMQHILIKDSIFEGVNNAMGFGRQQNVVPELFSCVVTDSEFRCLNSTFNQNAAALLADGGELTAMNCRFTVQAPAGHSDSDKVAVQVKNGGQAALTNCAATVFGDSGSSSTHIGAELVGGSSRLKSTGCSLTAFDGNPNLAFQSSAGIDEHSIDVTLLIPAS